LFSEEKERESESETYDKIEAVVEEKQVEMLRRQELLDKQTNDKNPSYI